jgi:hypothetical protein
MLAVGVIEIIAGIGMLLKPKIFAYVVVAWLLGIIVNLLLIPGYYDVALRDLGLCLAALALDRLSAAMTAKSIRQPFITSYERSLESCPSKNRSTSRRPGNSPSNASAWPPNPPRPSKRSVRVCLPMGHSL